MPTLTLRPTGAGTYTELTPSTGANYTCVDETSADDADYVKNPTNSTTKTDTYAMADHTSEVGSISTVEVYWRSKKAAAGAATVTPRLILGGTNSDGSTQNNLTSFATYSQTVARPGGGSWSWTDIDGLEAGVIVIRTSTEIDVSWLYIVVTYTLPVATALPKLWMQRNRTIKTNAITHHKLLL